MKAFYRMLAGLLSAGMLLSSAAAEGSWGQINQKVERSAAWHRFASESPYTLGEAVPLEGMDMAVMDWGNYPSIDGSTVCVPMGMELARQLLDLPEGDLNGFVMFSTTHYAYERLIEEKPNPGVTVLSRRAMMDDTHPVDLFLGTAPSQEELALAEKAGVRLVMVPVCYDAFVFLVNEANPVTGLTVGQVQQIYTGELMDWGEIGGLDGAEIQPYQRPANSGSQTAMEEMVMCGLTMMPSYNFISDGMGDLVAQVGNYDNGRDALGYSYLYYVDALYRSGDIRLLALDGAEPTVENIRSGAYPYTVNYYAVYREGDGNAAAFVDWMLSEEGQRSLAQAGYITLY